MLIKVKTLTGKEIEIDIEPTDRVERIKVKLFMDKDCNRRYPERNPHTHTYIHFDNFSFRRGLRRRRGSHRSSRGSSFPGSRFAKFF